MRVTRRKPNYKGSLPNICSQRKARIKNKAKQRYKCESGPLDGEGLHLTTAGTMVFTLNWMRGFYNHLMEWVSL